MAKNRNKKKKTGKAPMDITSDIDSGVADLPQAMDTSESAASILPASGSSISKVKKGIQMKRSKNVRKRKAIAKAISKSEKISEKASKIDSKKMRIQSAKSLYD